MGIENVKSLIKNAFLKIARALILGFVLFVVMLFVFGSLFGIAYLSTEYSKWYVLLCIPYLGGVVSVFLD